MEKMKRMVPFICHFAAGVYGRNGSDLQLAPELVFEKARATGWSRDPRDPGGATMVDVTIGAYKEYRKSKGLSTPSEEDLRAIPFEEWLEILKTMYWDKWRASEIESPGIAHLLTDWVWASGAGSIRSAQKVIGVKPDGIVGPVTLRAINGNDPAALFRKLYASRENYYRSCRGARWYLSGWLRRLAAIRSDGSFLIYGRSF